MLNKLVIINYAIIEHLEIQFFKGFTVISGETGSGKSIILSAINMLLGSKFNTTSIRDKSKKVIIEGKMDISQLSIQNFFLENDIDYEDELIIRREFNFEGKSRSFINDSPVKIKILKNLSHYLIDIHSQHENLLINTENFQIKLLDQFSIKKFDEFSNLINNYSDLFQKLKQHESNLDHKQKLLLNSNYDIDFYNNLIRDVELLDLKEEEEDKLNADYNKLSNINVIKTTINELIFNLEDGDNSVLNQLNLLNSKLSNISTYDTKLAAIFDRFKVKTIDINDIVMEAHNLNQNLNYDNSRLEHIQNRINTINSLEKKLNVIGVNGILTRINEIKSELHDILNASEDIDDLKKTINDIKVNLIKYADDLSFLRKKSAIELASVIESDLLDLGIDSPSLSFQFSRNPELLSHGYDSVALYFSANKGYDMMPINQIASGGEVARLMLCVKKHLFSMLDFATIVFDEVDAGVSGEIGRKMGRILKEMSFRGQIICVTHLPQIASLSDAHYKVLKKTMRLVSLDVIKLNDNERINGVSTYVEWGSSK